MKSTTSTGENEPIEEAFGTPEDLERIADLEWSGFDTLHDLEAFLEENHVTESLVAPIKEYASRKPDGYLLPTIEVGDRHRARTGWFAAMIDLRWQDDLPAIRIHGGRKNGGLFDYQYSLSLPLQDGFSPDWSRAPEAWYKTISSEVKFDHHSPYGETGSPDTVVYVLQEAAAEMAQAIREIEKRKATASLIGNLATEKLLELT